jgi:hypothetical protein
VSADLRTDALDPMARLKVERSENPCPALTAGEYEALKASIQTNGYVAAFPITRSSGPASEGKLIDGFHRSQVCEELGIEPATLWQPCETDTDFRIYQIMANVTRRQLATHQKAALGIELKGLYAQRAKDRQKAAGAANLARFNDPSLVGQPVVELDGPPEAGRADEQAARDVGISRETLRQYEAIVLAQRPDLLAKVDAGLSIKQAYHSLVAPRDAARDHQKQWERDNDEVQANMDPVSAPSGTSTSERDRAAGDAVRLALELDAHVRRHNLSDQDILDYKSRPHTATGTFRRLADWVDLAASALELNR